MNAKRALYETAKQERITEAKVRSEIQKAIDIAWWETGGSGGRLSEVPCKGVVPTPEELLEYLYAQLAFGGGQK